MEKKMMKSNGAGSRSSAMKRRRLLSAAAVLLICCLAFVGAVGADGNVAKVGDTEYTTIDEAITAWTAGTTLTLLADVTLSDVIELMSTEYHILDLGTYTMTAANKKDAIIITNCGRSSASYTLDIIADSENPGRIIATGKACVKTMGKSGVKDRPIVRIYGGVFTASNCLYHSGSNGTNSPQFQIYGGTFNGGIFSNRALIQIYGGTFNGALMCSVDSSSYLRIEGGRFTELKNNFMSALNSNKFTIGSSKGAFDCDVYVDDDGYFVVKKPISEKPGNFEAYITKGWDNYLEYSNVKTEGKLYYTDLQVAVEKNKNKKIELCASISDEISVPSGKTTFDLTSGTGEFTGTVSLSSGSSQFIIKYKEDNTVSNPAQESITPWTVKDKDGNVIVGSKSEPDSDGVVTHTYSNTFTITFVDEDGTELQSSDVAYGETPAYTGTTPSKESTSQYTYTHSGWTPKITSVTGDATYTATYSSTVNEYTITFVNEDGTELQSSDVAYGETPAYTGTTPSKESTSQYTYTHTGWTPEITAVTGVATYTATYSSTANEYTITFNTDGGTEIAPITQDYNTEITVPTAPTKEGYIFAGWDKEIPSTMPAEDTTVTALWTEKTYGLSAAPAKVGFDSVKVGYSPVAAKEVTITNNGNVAVTLEKPDSASYTIGGLPVEIVAGGSAKITIQPNAGLPVGNYDATLEIISNGQENIEIPVSFLVYQPSGSGSGDGGHLSFPRTTTNGGLVDFGSSKVIKAVLLPEGSSGSVLLKVDTVEKWPKALETEYPFDISVEKLGDGMAYIHFEIPVSVLESLELTPADICAYHFEGEVWTKLPTTYEVKDGTVCYEAETDSFSPFKLVIEEGAATQKEEENVPTVLPTEEPDVPDEPEILPPIDEPTKPADEPETPAPILAVLAGLGAAFIVRRK